MNRKVIFIWIFMLSCTYHTRPVEERPQTDFAPLKIDNFAALLWPTTSFGIGQNIFHKNAIAPYLTILHMQGEKQTLTELFLQVGYGITNKVSLLITLPIFANLKINDYQTQGTGDATLQFEWAFYQKSRETFFNQATVLANITLPTGHLSSTLQPSTGLGSISLFLGATLSHTSDYWYTYLSDGIQVTTPHRNTLTGSTIFYEWGIGRNIGSPSKSVLVAVLEFNGVYTQKTKSHCCLDPDTGGNTIFLGPTLSCAFKNAQFFGGIQFPVYQHLNGTQNKQKYRLEFNAVAAF